MSFSTLTATAVAFLARPHVFDITVPDCVYMVRRNGGRERAREGEGRERGGRG